MVAALWQQLLAGYSPCSITQHSSMLQEHCLLPGVCSELGLDVADAEIIRPGLARLAGSRQLSSFAFAPSVGSHLLPVGSQLARDALS